MKYIRALLLIILIIVGFKDSYAQSADAVIEKYIKAIGGREKLSQIKTIYVVTESKILGMKILTRNTILYGKGIRTETVFRDTKSISVYTDKLGWTTSSKDNYKIQLIPQDQYKYGKEQIFICSPFLNYSARGFKAILDETEVIRKEKAIKIKMVSPDNLISEYFFDSASFYLVKTIQKTNMNGREVEIAMYYSNYKDTGTGYLMPFTIEMKFGIMSNTSNVTEVSFNMAVDESIFIKP